MKKSLIALAILGGAAVSSQAANVNLYGTVDAGLMYKNHKVTVAGEQIGNKESSFKMADGIDGANKIGLKGEESLGNAKVGFLLENQFNVSNGEFKNSSKLFSREARLYVRNQFGELAAGRFGGLASAAGSYDLFFGEADAFDGGDNNIKTGFVQSDRYDNSIAFQSPEIHGLQGTLMYSFQKDGKQADKMKDNDRYIGAGLTFKQDTLSLVGVFEGQIRPNGAKNDHYKNGFTYSIGGNYDFGVAKIFAGAQWARNANFSDIQHGMNAGGFVKNVIAHDPKAFFNASNSWADGIKTADELKSANENLKEIVDYYAENKTDDMKEVTSYTLTLDTNPSPTTPSTPATPVAADAYPVQAINDVAKVAGAHFANNTQYNGYALTLGSQIPLGADKVTVAGYLGHYKNAHHFLINKKDAKLSTYGIDARYEHSLSKRTTLAAGAGIGQSQIKYHSTKAKSKIGQIYAGLHHNF